MQSFQQLTTCISQSLSALFLVCLKMSCSHFFNMSVRQNAWKKKNFKSVFSIMGQNVFELTEKTYQSECLKIYAKKHCYGEF